MPKKLDYRAVWTDARALLAADKEAIAAIAGSLFLCRHGCRRFSFRR